MLSSFTVENFKSYRQATLTLEPLTILIGANGSGKSNLIEALRLLSWIAQGNTLGSISHAVQKQNGIRGTVRDLGFKSHGTVSLACHTTHDRWNEYSITLDRHNDELTISDERLTGTNKQTQLFEIVDTSEKEGTVKVTYDNFARSGRKPRVTCHNRMPILIQFQSSASFGMHQKAQEIIPHVLKQYQDWLSTIVFLEPQPLAMRGYSFRERRLSGDGANLSGVLYNLCSQPETKDALLQFVKALPEQDIKAISFIRTTPRDEVMVQLTETFGSVESQYDATLLSDGTLRVLAIAAAVLSAPSGSLVVIEEIDNGIHPSRARQLLGRLLNIACERHLRVLLSSHNPALLDALPDHAVPHVVFCYRHTEDGASQLICLKDMENYPGLVAQGPLGQLMTQGVIDRLVKHSLGEKNGNAKPLPGWRGYASQWDRQP